MKKTEQNKQSFGEIKVEGVTKTFLDEGKQVEVLKDCTMVVPRGKLTVLMGPSGCGKTSLINLIAGYEQPDSGQILLDGEPVNGPGPERLVVFQETALFSWMTVLQNVTFGPSVQGIPKAVARERALQILQTVGLKDFKDKYPSQLSGGMQRRAELARALINEPKVMILDEPFRGLDAMTREIMQEFYVNLFQETGMTNLFVTHDLEEAIFLADRLVIMTYKPGKIKEVIEVDLPRPRHFTMITTQRFNELRQYALELLYHESTKAFADGCKSAFDLIDGFSRGGAKREAM
ncbi:MAG: ABC transporter ATP-binding protein [Bacillota bacterium]